MRELEYVVHCYHSTESDTWQYIICNKNGGSLPVIGARFDLISSLCSDVFRTAKDEHANCCPWPNDDKLIPDPPPMYKIVMEIRVLEEYNSKIETYLTNQNFRKYHGPSVDDEIPTYYSYKYTISSWSEDECNALAMTKLDGMAGSPYLPISISAMCNMIYDKIVHSYIEWEDTLQQTDGLGVITCIVYFTKQEAK